MAAFVDVCAGVLLLAASCGIMTWVWKALRPPVPCVELPDLASLLPRGLATLPLEKAIAAAGAPATPPPNLYKERMEFLNMVMRERLEDQADKEHLGEEKDKGPIETEAAVLSYNPGGSFNLAPAVEDDAVVEDETQETTE